MIKKFTSPQRERPEFVRAEEFTPMDIKWMWYPYIPQGTVTAIYGRGGMGKSWITCDLAARISSGRSFPNQDDKAAIRPQQVLMLSAEDDYKTVLVPRLIKMDANLHNVILPNKQFILDPSGLGWMQDAMDECAATVAFIDPIIYYAGGRMDINKANEVREMMEKLKRMAEKTHSAVIIVGHIRKSQEGHDGDQMMGSADWINASRSGLFVTQTNDGTRIMKQSKNNYGPTGPALSYSLDENGFTWGDVYDIDRLPAKKRGKRAQEAVDFLRNLLANGPEPARAVLEAAREAGIPTATLDRAKIGVAESYYDRLAGGWLWRLIPEDL